MRCFFFIASLPDARSSYKKTTERGAGVLYGEPLGPRVSLAKIELDATEALTLLQLVRTRLVDLERFVQNLEEGEGMDLQRHNALKSMRPQVELLETLTIKLAGATNELTDRR